MHQTNCCICKKPLTVRWVTGTNCCPSESKNKKSKCEIEKNRRYLKQYRKDKLSKIREYHRRYMVAWRQKEKYTVKDDINLKDCNDYIKQFSNFNKKKRKCLKCGKMFTSKCVGNRICKKCGMINSIYYGPNDNTPTIQTSE